jgi:hypothetical protein
MKFGRFLLLVSEKKGAKISKVLLNSQGKVKN